MYKYPSIKEGIAAGLIDNLPGNDRYIIDNWSTAMIKTMGKTYFNYLKINGLFHLYGLDKNGLPV
jgi:hypothetical protein